MPFRTARLTALERDLSVIRRTLEEQWAGARPADRLLAVDRLMREGSLAPDVAVRLRTVQASVRDAWAAHRAARSFGHGTPADVRSAALRLELVERARDAFMTDEGLFDPLFLVAEGYVRTSPCAGPSFRDLWHAHALLVRQLVRFTSAIDDDAWRGRPRP